MRERFFRLLMHALQRRTPALVCSLEHQVLLNLTAHAFQVTGRRIWLLRPEQSLQAYAEFTKSCMEYPAEAGRIYVCARNAGATIRRITGFHKKEDLEQLVFYLYRNLRIQMTGTLPGEIFVSECYFSRAYVPEECAIMSNVDAGIMAGICGEGELIFSQRITDGCSQCRACFYKKEDLA